MPENDFLPFAIAVGANVMSQGAYAANAALGPGVSAGIADPTLYNKSIRQATFVAAAIATFIVNETGDNALDDGNLTEFVANFTAAIGDAVAGNIPYASNAQALAGSSTVLAINPSTMAYVIGQKALLLTGGTVAGAVTVNGAFVVQTGQSFTAVNAVLNASLGQMPALTFKSNLTGGTANAADNTVASVQAALGINATSATQYFSANTTFVVPAGVYSLKIRGKGGGGGGGGAGAGASGGGGGGGGEGLAQITVAPGTMSGS